MRCSESSSGFNPDNRKPSVASAVDGESERPRNLLQLNPQEPSTSVSLSLDASLKKDIGQHLHQSGRGLSSLKIKFYDLLIKIDDCDQPATITAEEIKEWLKTLEVVEEQIKNIRNKTE